LTEWEEKPFHNSCSSPAKLHQYN